MIILHATLLALLSHPVIRLGFMRVPAISLWALEFKTISSHPPTSPLSKLPAYLRSSASTGTSTWLDSLDLHVVQEV